MFNKGNIFELIKLVETRGACIEEELYGDCPSIKLPSQLICDRGEMISDIADLLNVAGIAIEIRSSYSSGQKGKAEKIFRSNRELQNV